MITDEIKDKMKEFVIADGIRTDLRRRIDADGIDYDWAHQIMDILSMKLMDLEDEIEKAIKS